MKYFVGVLLLSLIALQLHANTLRVLNAKDLSPIPNVAVFNHDKTVSALTNENGEIDFSVFDASDVLTFQHPGYFKKTYPYASLAQLNYIVKLDERLVDLTEVVVSANKWEQNKSEIPNKIAVLEARDIKLHNPQTCADLLGGSNEVFIQKSQLGGGSPMIRGFSANSVLLVVDGIRMNNAIYRSGNLQNVITLDPNIMESAEVVFGPGSIIYGSDALGGVMDFHTKKVRLNAPDGKRYTTNIMSRISTANFEKTFHADVNYHGGKWGWLTSISFSDFDDLRQGKNGLDEFDHLYYVERKNDVDQVLENSNKNIQKGSAYRQVNFLQKFRFHFDENLDVNYSFYLTTSSDVPRYDRLIQMKDDLPKYAEWFYGPQYWMYHALNFKLKKGTSFYDAAQINLTYQDMEESRYSRKLNSEKMKTQIEKVDVFTLNVDFDKMWCEKTTLFYGFEGMYNYVKSEAYNKNIMTGAKEDVATRYPDGGNDYYSFAMYASFKSNLHKKLTLTGGLRFSYVKFQSKFLDKTFFDFPFDEIKLNNENLTASLGLVYRPSETSQLNLNLSSGFRAPNLDDVTKIFDSTPGNVIMPNDNLKPEKAYNIDLGFIKRFGDIVSLNAVAFYTYLDNAMVRRDFTFNGESQIMYDGVLSQVQAIVNAASANIWGASLKLDVALSAFLKLHTDHTFTKGEDNEKNKLRHVPPFFGNLGLTYERNRIFADFYVQYNGEISYKNLAPSERDKDYMYAIDDEGNPYSPAWLTLNLKSSYLVNESLSFDVGIENILDKRYRPYSSGISAPGINLYVAFRAKF